MRKLLLLIPVLLVVSVAMAEDEAVEPKEALRRRLCDALRAQPSIHHAMRLEINATDQEPYAFFTEYFQEGEIAGMRLVHSAGEDTEEFGIFVTDGNTLRIVQEGASVLVLRGVRPMNAYYAPYYAAVQRLSRRWGVAIPCAPFRALPYLNLEEEGGTPGVKFSLAYSREEAPAGWLTSPYFEAHEVTLLEEVGLVRLQARTYEGRLRLEDGLPVSWSGRNPKTGGTATAEVAEIRWTGKRWREEIARLCEGAETGESKETAEIEEMALWQVLLDVFKAVPAALDGTEKLDALIEEAVGADLTWHGPNDLPPEADAATRKAHVTQRSDEVKSAFYELALKAEWSEVAARALGDRAAEAWRKDFAEAGGR